MTKVLFRVLTKSAKEAGDFMGLELGSMEWGKVTDDICFARIPVHTLPNHAIDPNVAMEYYLPNSVNQLQLGAWVRLMTEVLFGRRLFEVRVVSHRVHFLLDMTNLRRNQMLAILTCIRYIDEFPRCVEQYYKLVEPEGAFYKKNRYEALIQAHILSSCGYCGHGLIYDSTKTKPPVVADYKTFRKNWKNQLCRTVNGMFLAKFDTINVY